MAITYNNIDFDVVDNGDGTFTLTPQSPATAAELIRQYRSLRQEGLHIIERRQDLQAKHASLGDRLTELATQRDELKTLLENAGETPDDDITP